MFAGIMITQGEYEELQRLRKEVSVLRQFVDEVAGDHEHQWEAVDPQEVWACQVCHEDSQDYATDVQTRAQYLKNNPTA